MEWSNEKIQLFIELYEEEPAIWNPKDPGHKSRNNVHDAWTKIKTKFCEGTGESISVEELKKKKENLMATYRKLNTKVKSSSTSGSGTDDMFKPNWPFYEQMAKFLHGVYKPTKTKSSEVRNYLFNLYLIFLCPVKGRIGWIPDSNALITRTE